MVSHQIKFPNLIHHGCIAGSKVPHASGISVSYMPRQHFVDIESINSQGTVTTSCRIPLHPDPSVINEFADALRDIAKHITNGTA